MDTTNIYSVVNSVTAQSMGGALAAYDAEGLISLGNAILSSTTNTEGWLNALLQRIGRTVISTRSYRNKLGDLVIDSFRYGALLQKISFGLPSAETDQMYDIEDGDSVDMYKVSKPAVTQKLFYTRAPYQFHISTQYPLLEEAFLSEEAMAAFIGGCMNSVRNMLELSAEDLGRATISNMIAELSDKTTRVVNLVTLYNTAANPAADLTAATAVFDPDFLRFAIRTINTYSKKFTDMGKIYNDGTVPRFTPFEEQKLYLITDFDESIRTVVQYSAFNEEMVRINAFNTLNFWQTPTGPMSINVERASDGTAKNLTNIVGIMFDRDALGTYRKDERVFTTPLNAAGAYYNTYWHLKELWFNDLSENAVYFTLN